MNGMGVPGLGTPISLLSRLSSLTWGIPVSHDRFPENILLPPFCSQKLSLGCPRRTWESLACHRKKRIKTSNFVALNDFS